MSSNKLQNIAKKFIDQNFYLGVAESCTGGLLAKKITDESGSSAWFDCGFITYSNEDEFSVTRDFSYATKGWNSSVMKWNNATETERIWNGFLADKSALMQLQGDQNVISKLTTDIVEDMPNLKVKPKDKVKPYPDEWTFSYKWHDRKDPRFDRGRWDFSRGEGSIAVFHGKPDPHDSEQDWVKENWK